jgi:hypothetical protein
MQPAVLEAIAKLCAEVGGEDFRKKTADLTWPEVFSKYHRSLAGEVFREDDV